MGFLSSLGCHLLLALTSPVFAAAHTSNTNSTQTPGSSHRDPEDGAEIIERDVAIIGGGSSGTYSAIRLQQLGHSVALIEKEDRLGGHVNTYVDPATGGTFDYGVIILVNITLVQDYFKYLDTPLGEYTGFGTGGTYYVDFAEAKSVPAPNNTEAEAAAVQKYAQLLQEKYPYLASGFHLPDPVPEELLMPYGDFLAERNISALAYTAWYIDEGVGNILAQPALYMLKYYNLLQVEGLNLGFVNANNNYQGLYNSALMKLGNNTSAFLSSHITSITRSPTGAQITFNHPAGRKILKAKKLIITIPPLLTSLQPILDLSPTEKSLFAQFNSSYIWDAIIKNTGIPSGTAVQNLDPEAPNNIPAAPASYAFVPSPFQDVHATWYGSDVPLSEQQVKENMLSTLSNIRKAKGYNTSCEPEFLEFHSHNPYELTVSTDAIREGFYGKVNALQGQWNTFWTGAAWESHDSTAIWNFTEFEILPRVVEGLRK